MEGLAILAAEWERGPIWTCDGRSFRKSRSGRREKKAWTRVMTEDFHSRVPGRLCCSWQSFVIRVPNRWRMLEGYGEDFLLEGMKVARKAASICCCRWATLETGLLGSVRYCSLAQHLQWYVPVVVECGLQNINILTTTGKPHVILIYWESSSKARHGGYSTAWEAFKADEPNVRMNKFKRLLVSHIVIMIFCL